MYGERFVKSYGEFPPKIWAQCINRMTNDHIAKSLANLGKAGSPHPPSLPEFYSAGKTSGVRYAGGPSSTQMQLTQDDEEFTIWGKKANITMLRVIIARPENVDKECLAKMLKAKAVLVSDAELFEKEGEPYSSIEDFQKVVSKKLHAVINEHLDAG